MKFAVRIFTVIPGTIARSYEFSVDADSMDTAQIQLSRKIAHDWVEIPNATRMLNVRTSYIAATEIEQVIEEEPAVPEPSLEVIIPADVVTPAEVELVEMAPIDETVEVPEVELAAAS